MQEKELEASLDGIERICVELENILYSKDYLRRQRLVQKLRLARPDYPISKLALLIVEFKPEIDPSLHQLIDAYREYWNGNPNFLRLSEINRRRAAAFGQSESSDWILHAIQFLTGAEHWRTCQDGVVMSICEYLLRAGVAPQVIESTLLSYVRRNS